MQTSFAFVDTGSGIHRLSAFVMPAWVMAVMAAALVLEHPLFLLGIFLSTIPVALAARVARRWASLMKYAAVMCLAIVAINAIVSNQGSHVLLEAGFRLPLLGTPCITVEAIAFGAAMGVRLCAIISAFALLNMCVHPDDLMGVAIKLRLPYKSVLVTSLSTRFVPVLLADAGTIADVQRSRGLEFDRGGVLERIRSRAALILPLLSNSLDRAVQLAEAMESRAYGASPRRTFYREVPMTPDDVAAIVLVAGAVALVIAVRAVDLASYLYYPSLDSVAMTSQQWGLLALLCALLLSVIALAGLRRRHTGD